MCCRPIGGWGPRPAACSACYKCAGCVRQCLLLFMLLCLLASRVQNVNVCFALLCAVHALRRIFPASFSLDGKQFKLVPNDGNATIHGGAVRESRDTAAPIPHACGNLRVLCASARKHAAHARTQTAMHTHALPARRCAGARRSGSPPRAPTAAPSLLPTPPRTARAGECSGRGDADSNRSAHSRSSTGGV